MNTRPELRVSIMNYAALIKECQDELRRTLLGVSREVESALRSVVEFMKINFERNHLSLLNTFYEYLFGLHSNYCISVSNKKLDIYYVI